MTAQDWMFLFALLILAVLPVLVLPFRAARNTWKINSLTARLIVLSGALLTLGIILTATTQLTPTSIASSYTMIVPDFLKELLRLIAPFWILSLVVGILFPYAATFVLFVLPECRFRDWLSIETDLIFENDEAYSARIRERLHK